MPEYQFVPLEAWPGERTRDRQRSPFHAGWSRMVDDLDRELTHLGATNIVIQADCARDQIRLDWFLRSDAKLRGPGVVLSFDSKVGPLSYPCDTYTDWQANVRAITLALAALRAVDRYGVTRRAEQYKGWARISGAVGEFSTVENAARFIAAVTDSWDEADVIRNPETYLAAYREAAAAVHPDRNGGDDSRFKSLQAAREMLEKHHGL